MRTSATAYRFDDVVVDAARREVRRGGEVQPLQPQAFAVLEHWLVGVGWRGTIAGTFINSHGDRSWMAGVAREVVTWERGACGASAGYRLGLVRGYDERLHRLAGRWPAVPAGELVGTVRRGRVGVTVSYAGIVTSVGAFVVM